jgi:hypothetical protein
MLLKEVEYRLSTLLVRVKFFSNGDPIDGKNGVYTNCELELTSNHGDASFKFYENCFDPKQLRELANLIEKTRFDIASEAKKANQKNVVAKSDMGMPESGFEPYEPPPNESCNHPEHNPPNMMVIPQGQRYRHVCPSCGQMVILYPREIKL